MKCVFTAFTPHSFYHKLDILFESRLKNLKCGIWKWFKYFELNVVTYRYSNCFFGSLERWEIFRFMIQMPSAMCEILHGSTVLEFLKCFSFKIFIHQRHINTWTMCDEYTHANAGIYCNIIVHIHIWALQK